MNLILILCFFSPLLLYFLFKIYEEDIMKYWNGEIIRQRVMELETYLNKLDQPLFLLKEVFSGDVAKECNQIMYDGSGRFICLDTVKIGYFPLLKSKDDFKFMVSLNNIYGKHLPGLIPVRVKKVTGRRIKKRFLYEILMEPLTHLEDTGYVFENRKHGFFVKCKKLGMLYIKQKPMENFKFGTPVNIRYVAKQTSEGLFVHCELI